MAERMPFAVGDVVVMKKKHPCGSFRWRLLRVGADIRMECLGCGRMVMVPRPSLDKSAKSLEKATPEDDLAPGGAGS